MRKTFMFAATAALLSPSALLADPNAPSESDRVDVAYKALAEGRTNDAITELRESDAIRAGEPAALINLGSAYARQGRVAEAREMFKAAIDSKTRYNLELANGSWVDSRTAARLALEALENRADIAMR